VAPKNLPQNGSTTKNIRMFLPLEFSLNANNNKSLNASLKDLVRYTLRGEECPFIK
jgi:hypothetical protein